MLPEIPQETLHKLYRGYCLDKFPYDYPADQAEARESHIERDTRSYYAECGDQACEGNCGHVGALARLVEVAFAAGRESAYDRDEWRVCSGPVNKHLTEEFQFQVFADVLETLDEAVGELAQARKHWRSQDSWIEHCRTGRTPYSRVPEAGGPDELQA